MLNELERNLHDALAVTKTLMRSPKILPGGGAAEMSASVAVAKKVFFSNHFFEIDSVFCSVLIFVLFQAKAVGGVEQWAYKSAAHALEVNHFLSTNKT